MSADLEKLQGSWEITSLEIEGNRMPESAVKGSRIIVKGDSFTTVGVGAGYGGILKLGTESGRPTLDLLFTDGPEKGNASLAIYRLESSDRWLICLGLTGRDRPKEFVTSPGSGHALETLERRTPGGEQGAPDAEMTRLGGEWDAVLIASNGEHLADAFVKLGKRVVKGNALTVSMGGQTIIQATLIVNPSTAPKSIDYLLTGGEGKGRTLLGIYEWKGDTLRTIFGPPGAARPAEFVTKPGDQRTLSMWKKHQP